jgi:TolA-binding protein
MNPDHSKVPQAYVEIATCYEKLGEEMQARYVYQEMVDNLDPSLQHAIFAKQKVEEG